MIPLESYQRRRAEVLARIGGDLMIVPTARPRLRNGDTHYRFRPDSDFYYLTGFDEPHAILVLAPGREDGQQLLFLQDRDPRQEIWTGRRLGVERAPEALGVDRALAIERFAECLGGLLAGRESLYYRTGRHATLDREIRAAIEKLRSRPRRALAAPECLRSPEPILHEMRLHKDPAEIAVLRRGAAITVEAHREAMVRACPGRFEYEVEACLEAAFRSRGAGGPAYPSIVAGGANATTLHYDRNSARLEAGELLLVDAGAELECYAVDVTRTYPVDGRFSALQRRIYEWVWKAQQAAIEAAVVGAPFDAPHRAARQVLADALADLGLTGNPDANEDHELLERVYPHRTSHWLGLDVHDTGSYYREGSTHRELEAGMVLTVEPGLYFPPEDESLAEELRGVGIRIEDDVLVDAAGPEVLTGGLEKSVAEIECLLERRSRS